MWVGVCECGWVFVSVGGCVDGRFVVCGCVGC